MAGERYVERAVARLASYIESNLATELRAIETAQGLASGAIRDPVAYVPGRVPNDNRPIVEVYETSWNHLDHAQQLMSVSCEVLVTHLGDADVLAGQLTLRRYATALADIIHDDPTLGGTVAVAILLDGESDMVRGDASATRHILVQGVEIHVQEIT